MAQVNIDEMELDELKKISLEMKAAAYTAILELNAAQVRLQELERQINAVDKAIERKKYNGSNPVTPN